MKSRHRPELVDEAFRAFAHPLRRELLCLLDDSEDGTVKVDYASNHLSTMRDITTEQVRFALLHVHLPRLRAAGFIEYDERSGTIRYQNHRFSEEILGSGLLSDTA